MLPILLSLETLSSDPSQSKFVEPDFQTQMMLRLVHYTGFRKIATRGKKRRNIEPVSLERFLFNNSMIPEENSQLTVCGWYGVSCKDGVIYEIGWTQLSFSPHYEWIPSTCKHLSISVIRFTPEEAFEIGNLPRSLINGVFIDANLYGTLALSRLPSQIVTFSVNENNFSGTVDLTRLPETLEELHVHMNPIAVCVYDAKYFSEALRVVSLQRNYGRRQIVITKNGDTIDSRIQFF